MFMAPLGSLSLLLHLTLPIPWNSGPCPSVSWGSLFSLILSPTASLHSSATMATSSSGVCHFSSALASYSYGVASLSVSTAPPGSPTHSSHSGFWLYPGSSQYRFHHEPLSRAVLWVAFWPYLHHLLPGSILHHLLVFPSSSSSQCLSVSSSSPISASSVGLFTVYGTRGCIIMCSWNYRR